MTLQTAVCVGVSQGVLEMWRNFTVPGEENPGNASTASCRRYL